MAAVAPDPTPTTGRQIPIVCPGHTRPLAELQFISIPETNTNDDQTTTTTITRTFLLSACHDKMPMLRDATTGDWIGTFAGHKGAVWSCRLDPAALLAGTASGDFSVQVWDAITGQSLYTFPHRHVVKTIDWSLDSRRLATGGHEGILRIFDMSQPKKEPLMLDQSTQEKVSISKCNWLNNSTVLAAGEDGNIRIWNVDDDDETTTTDDHSMKRLRGMLTVGDGIRDMEISTLSSGRRILTVAAGEKVTFFDIESGQEIKSHKMPIHFKVEGGASLHPSGTKFIAGGGRRGGSMALGAGKEGGELGSDLLVYVFDFETGKMLECHKGHHGPVRCLRYHPDGKSYATGSEDGTIRLWKTDP